MTRKEKINPLWINYVFENYTLIGKGFDKKIMWKNSISLDFVVNIFRLINYYFLHKQVYAPLLP
jgi:hypothetical protein